MPERRAEVSLASSGIEAITVVSTVTLFTAGQRVRRAAALLGISVLMAASLLPIPIIHLIGPPLILLAGGVIAWRQLRARMRLAPTWIVCPKCGAVNRVGGGVGVRDVGLPVERLCESCRRVLTLRVTMIDDR